MNKKELMLLSIGIFLTVVAWLIADIYHAATVEQVKAKEEIPAIKKYDLSKDILQILKEKTE